MLLKTRLRRGCGGQLPRCSWVTKLPIERFVSRAGLLNVDILVLIFIFWTSRYALSKKTWILARHQVPTHSERFWKKALPSFHGISEQEKNAKITFWRFWTRVPSLLAASWKMDISQRRNKAPPAAVGQNISIMRVWACIFVSTNFLFDAFVGLPFQASLTERIPNRTTWKLEINRELQKLLSYLTLNYHIHQSRSFQIFFYLLKFLIKTKWEECTVCETQNTKKTDIWSICKMVLIKWNKQNTEMSQNYHLHSPANYGMNLTVTKLVSTYSGKSMLKHVCCLLCNNFLICV